MSKKDTSNMAKLPGLYQRDGVYQLRVVVPPDLRHKYGGRTTLRESLHTRHLQEARTKGTAARALRLVEFDEHRKQAAPQRLEAVSAELGRILATRVAHRILATDDKIRGNPTTAQALVDVVATHRQRALSGLMIPGSPVAPALAPVPPMAPADPDPLAGLDEELARDLASINEGAALHAARASALYRLKDVLPLVKAEAHAMGLEFDERAPGAADALRECLRAYRKAWQDVNKRDQGEPIETPSAPTRVTAMAEVPTKLRDILPKWKASKERRPDTIRSAEKALALYEDATGNPPIASLTRAQGVDMRAFLLASGVSAKTARDRFDYIKGFLNFACRELELIPRNPWEGLRIEFETAKPRRPWSGEQLRAMFSLPLFTRYELPTLRQAGVDAGYWIPLLGLFTGARVSELAQLRTGDVEVIDGVPMLRITDTGEGQKVKTAAGRRLVPIHAELVRLGFLEYVQKVRDVSSGADKAAASLWPALPLLKGKPGKYFSEWFNEHPRKAVEGMALPDFHSLRHTVRSRLASAGVEEPMIDALIGHEVKGSTGAKVYTFRSTDDMQAAIGRLAYPGLELPRVFKMAKAE